MTSALGKLSAFHRRTHFTRGRNPSIQSGPRPRTLRDHARTVDPVGTITVTSCPRPTSRSAYVKIARTPPAIRMCGDKNVILIASNDWMTDEQMTDDRTTPTAEWSAATAKYSPAR